MEKKNVSKILDNDNRVWNDIKDKLPDVNKPIVIRFTNPHYIYYETDTEIYHAEDIKLATCVRDYENPDDITKCEWHILPPYPKFDYSPLSSFDKLLEGTIVTHWAEASDEALNDWNSRFDISDTYLTLKFDIDDDHAELMYKALMYGLGAIGAAYSKEKTDELLAFHVVLNDLLNLIDKNIMIENGEEISLATDYDPSNEDSGTDEELEKIISSVKSSNNIDADDNKKLYQVVNKFVNDIQNVNIEQSKNWVEKRINQFINELGIHDNINISFNDKEE